MQEFMRKFEQLNGVEAKVSLEHCLFDTQEFYCDELQTINENDKIGLMLKNRKIFMYKQLVKFTDIRDNMYIVSDGRLTMKIIVNKM